MTALLCWVGILMPDGNWHATIKPCSTCEATMDYWLRAKDRSRAFACTPMKGMLVERRT